MSDKYLKILTKLNSMKQWNFRKIENLNYAESAADYFKINYKGSQNFTSQYTNLHNLRKNLQFIHVTGTNGKGSVSKKIAYGLQLSGLKTGLYTSPHISTILERITFNGMMIEQSFFMDKLNYILDENEKSELGLTYFDSLTMLMLNYFQFKQADIAVVEVGCGGRLDTTNIITPILSVITSIGLDHIAILGSTIESIATQKAGIIKQNVPSLIGPNANPKDVFQNFAKANNSKITVMENSYDSDFEKENSEIARKALQILRETYDKIYFNGSLTDEIIEKAVQAKQICRMEDATYQISCDFKNNKNLKLKSLIEQEKFNCFIDVGHNEAGVKKVFNEIKSKYPNSSISTICGFSSNKSVDSIVKVILDNSDAVYFATAENFRLFSKAELQQLQEKLNNKKIKDSGDIKEMLKDCFSSVNQNCEKRQIVLVLGSFFIMKDARQYLGYSEFVDPVFCQEKY